MSNSNKFPMSGITTREILATISDDTLDANRTLDLNAVQYHYTAPVPILTLDDADAATYYAVFNIQSYKLWSLHILADDIVCTAYVTNISTASDTDETDGNWIHRTMYYFPS